MGDYAFPFLADPRIATLAGGMVAASARSAGRKDVLLLQALSHVSAPDIRAQMIEEIPDRLLTAARRLGKAL